MARDLPSEIPGDAVRNFVSSSAASMGQDDPPPPGSAGAWGLAKGPGANLLGVTCTAPGSCLAVGDVGEGERRHSFGYPVNKPARITGRSEHRRVSTA